MKAQELLTAIGKGEILPLYYLYGEESYLRDACVRALVDRLVPVDLRDFNFDTFYGTDCRGEEIASASATLPMFAPWRVVLVKRAEGLSAATLETLGLCLRNPSPTTCLVFVGERIDQRKRFFVDFKKVGALVECKRLYENQLAPFIRSEASARGKAVESVAADLLVMLVGNNLQELVAELEKTVIFVGQRDKITIADIKAVVSDTRINTVFELTDALGARSLDRSLHSLGTLLAGGEAPLMVLSMIARHFRQLWSVRELMATNKSKAELASASGVNPYFMDGIMRQAKKFSPAELHAIFERIFAADQLLKGGGGKPLLVLESLVFMICGVWAPRH